FFRARCGAARRLPSFPTRRSSDLSLPLRSRADHLDHLVRIVRRAHQVEIARRDLAGLEQAVAQPVEHRSPPVAAHEQDGEVPDLDRKSTRLNSSHLVTSYAVFCLN